MLVFTLNCTRQCTNQLTNAMNIIKVPSRLNLTTFTDLITIQPTYRGNHYFNPSKLLRCTLCFVSVCSSLPVAMCLMGSPQR